MLMWIDWAGQVSVASRSFAESEYLTLAGWEYSPEGLDERHQHSEYRPLVHGNNLTSPVQWIGPIQDHLSEFSNVGVLKKVE